MQNPDVETHSLWSEYALPSHAALDRDIEVDVVIVGAGLTGITTAYLLRKEGVRVALIDRGKVAGADTARTTAHITYVTDYRLHELVDRFGKDGARAFWEAGDAAIQTIAQIARESQRDSEFRWIPGYLHAPVSSAGKDDKKERDLLERDAELAVELGFDATLLNETPRMHRPGVRFANQAKFHPRKYLEPLLSAIPGEGSFVFENTNFEEVEDEPLAVRANGHTIKCDYLVIATHNPLMGRKGLIGATLFQTKLSLYTSYVVGAEVPKDSSVEALFWDTQDPYDYLRVDDLGDRQYVIFGGCDVKTGQERNAEDQFKSVAARLAVLFPDARIRHRWMGQIVETDDGLPFIGENASREFIATGFCGNGFTLGTLAAMMARDRYLNRKNPWFDLLRVDRKPFHGGLWRYVRENLDYPYYLVRDRLAKASDLSVEQLRNGQGGILNMDGKRVAAYRSATGELTLLDPSCTHMKCLVRWNAADTTWDCPCHGSRFHAEGAVLSGPAEAPLRRIEHTH
jgi:glycine/D-amino acid oxidase-like deaminating enzyme/nitrite reductase/ring-hydroxylating ferredoxin subunit